VSLSVASGAFDTGTGAVATTVVVSGLGFQPKAILFWWNGRTGSVTASGRASHARGYGAATSTAQRWAVYGSSQDAVANTVAKSAQINTACVGILTAAGAIDGLLDLQSLDSGGFTLVVSDAFATSYRVQYLVLGGSDIVNAKAGTITLANASGDQDFTDPGFQPDFLAVATAGRTTINGTIGADSQMSFGMGSGTAAARQGVLANSSNDGAATSATMTYCKSGEILAAPNTTASGLLFRATMTSWLSTGFRLNLTAAPGGAAICTYLALQGGSYRVDSLATSLTLNATVVESGFGFPPLGLVLASGLTAESTAGTITTNDQSSVGSATSSSNRQAMGVMDQTGASTAEVVSTAVYVDEVYVNLSTTGTVEGLADVSSMDADGFTLIMDQADAVAAFAFYAAFGQATVPPGLGPAPDMDALTQSDPAVLAW
jgi:hypothetical protein